MDNFNLKSFRGLVFDFDGTMCRLFKNFNLQSVVLDIHEKMYNYGYNFPLDKDAFDIFDFINSLQDIDNKRKKELFVEMNVVLTQAELEGIKSCEPVNGVGEVLPYLKKTGFKIGVATNNSVDCVIKFLKEYCGGLDIPVVGRIGSEPQLLKPNKWSLVEVLRQMNCNISEAVFFGDTQRDYECAQNAGCKFIGIAPTEKKLLRLQKITPRINIISDFYELEKRI